MNSSGQPNSRVMTSREVSEYLRLPLSTVWNLTKTGKIRGFKVGKHWRYLESDILSFFNLPHPRTHSVEFHEERRSSARLHCSLPAEVRSMLLATGPIGETGRLDNLSEQGAHFVFSQGRQTKIDAGLLEPGNPVSLELSFPELNDRQMVLQGRIVHITSNGHPAIGIKFRLIHPEDQKGIKAYVG